MTQAVTPPCACSSGPIPPACRPNDTHICADPDPKHNSDHTCDCGFRWYNPEATVHVTEPWVGSWPR